MPDIFHFFISLFFLMAAMQRYPAFDNRQIFYTGHLYCI